MPKARNPDRLIRQQIARAKVAAASDVAAQVEKLAEVANVSAEQFEQDRQFFNEKFGLLDERLQALE